LLEDVRDLVSAVAPIAGNNPVIFVAAPPQAASLKLFFRGDTTYEVLASSALANGTVLAIASNAVAAVIAPDLSFDVSDRAVSSMSPLERHRRLHSFGQPHQKSLPGFSKPQ
jgi:hypothetical protein